MKNNGLVADDEEKNIRLKDALKDLIELSHELTTSFVPDAPFSPSALEFLRQVHSNFPIVYRGMI